MACMAVVASLSTTVGTGIIAGGTVTYMLAAPQAQAELTELVDQAGLITSASTTQGTGVYSNADMSVSRFSGTGAYLNITNQDIADKMAGGTGFVTIAVWVKTPKGSASQSYVGIGGQNDGFKVAQNGNYMQVTTKAVKDENFTGMTLNANTWTLVAFSIDLDQSGSDSYCYALNSGESIRTSRAFAPDWNDLSYESMAIGSGNGQNDRDLYTGMMAGMKVFYSDTVATADELIAAMGTSYSSANLTWKSSEVKDWATGTWDNAGTDTQWNGLSNATFAGTGETVTLSGDVYADVVSVTGTGWTLADATDSEGKLIAYGITVGDGATATELTIDTAIDSLSVAVKKEATLTLAKEGLNVSFTNDSLCEGTLYIKDGASVSVNGCNGGNAYIRGDVYIAGDGVLKLTTGDSLGWNNGTVPANINLQGTAATDDAAAKLAQIQVTGKQTLVSNINLSGNSNIYGGQLEFFGGDFSVSGTDNVIESELLSRKDATITVAGESTLLIAGGTRNGDWGQAENYRITKEGDGDLIVGGTLNHSGGTVVNAGSLVISDGGSLGANAITLADGATLKITGTGSYGNGNVTYDAGSNLIVDTDSSIVSMTSDATLNDLTITKGCVDIASNVSVGGVLTMTEDAAISVNAGNTLTLAAVEGNSISSLTVTGINAAGTYTVLDGSIEDITISELLLSVENGYEATYDKGVVTVVTAELAAVGSLTWQTDDADNTWINGSSKNWLNGTDEQRWVDTSDATFTGTGETVTISGPVTPNSISVTGADWEWTGDGSIACATTLTVGDGATASDLTISTTGSKTFTGGVLVTEGATLVVKNADAWSGHVTGAGTLEFATGTTLTTSSGILNTIIPSTDNNANTDGVIGTVKLTNNTVLSHDSGNGNNWRWVPSVVKFDITDGSRLNIDVNFDYATWDQSGDSIVRIAGAGDGSDGIAGAAVSFARNKHSLGALELADDATVYVAAGAQGAFTTYSGTGYVLTKTGTGSLEIGKGNASVYVEDSPDLLIKEGTMRFNFSGSDSDALSYNGKVTMKDGTTLDIYDGLTDFAGGMAFDGNVLFNNTWGKGLSISSLVEGDEDTVVKLTHDKAYHAVQRAEFSVANTYAGTWDIQGDWAFVATHEQAFEYATVNLANDDAALKIGTDTGVAKVGALSGTIGTVALASGETGTLELGTDGEAEYSGSVAAGVSLLMSGAGTQSFNGDMSAFDGDVTVSAGVLNIASGLSTADRTVSLGADTTLGAALELNGGTLTLDATGAAASLGGSDLTLGEGTTLNLTLLGTEVTGEQITLLTGIGSLAGVTAGEGGLLGSLGDLFTMGMITDMSVSADTPATADAGEAGSWAERLGRSELYYSEGELYLTLASNILAADPLYWDAAAGSGDWTGSNWSEEDKLGVDPGVMQDPWEGEKPVSVVFAGDTAATVTIDTDAVVTDMTVQDGDYTYAKDGETGTLTIEGKLTVESTGTADISGLGEVAVGSADIAGNLTADELSVGETLTMTDGTLQVDVLKGEGTAEITGGTVTIGSSTLSSTTVTGAEFTGNSMLAGDEDSAVSLGGVTVGDAASLTVTDATLTDQIDVATGGILVIGGAMHLDTTQPNFDLENKSTYALTADDADLGTEDGNGFVSRNEVYTVVTGDLNKVSGGESADWTVGADAREGEYADGKVTIAESKDTTTYWVNNGTSQLSKIDDNFADDTETIKLNGGDLRVDTALGDNISIETNNENTADTQSGIALQGEGTTLEADKLTINDGTTVTLMGAAGTILDLGEATTVDSKLTGLTEDTWKGTVKAGAVSGMDADLGSLGNSGSAVEVENINSMSLDASTIGSLKSVGDVSLTGGDSTVTDMEVDGNLSLGATSASTLAADALTVNGADGIALGEGSSVTADTLTVGAGITLGKDSSVQADSLEVGGTISLEEGSTIGAGTLTLGDETSIEFKKIGDMPVVTVDSLEADTLQVLIDNSLLSEAADAQADKTQPIATIMEVTEGAGAEITLNGGSKVINPTGEKYGYTLDWNDTYLQLMATANENYMKEKFEGGSANGMAGATIMDDAFASDAIGVGGDLEDILAAVDNGVMTDEGLAAVAGSSTAALGMAFAGDVERQLRAIRNRTTTMGVNQCVVNEGMPYFNAWVNAEGNLGELDKDGTYAGYQLESWGGTIGFEVDVNPNLTLGLAVTAMYGDLTVDGPDMLDGDLDTMYVSAFARYSSRAWTHTFIGTIGTMDSSYERTVSHAGGSYTAEGETDGLAFGLMYEVGRVYALNKDGSACLQPIFNVAYRHTSVGGYTEKGGDAALDVDDQTLDTVTLGAGARLQAVVGENLYNRTSLLELRALAKVDVGDRASEADVAFIGGGTSATVESAELGAFGVELGAGLSIPMGDEDSGTLFFDVSAELRSGYTNVNGTVGYRINF